ncbi:unnamed protein product [Owenia fusiformis]|uniref:Uncharacterized protein n=1 Tax=Owenia fusiformis TaxID=6347 RepID=A0A8J1TVK8_OWEFU|nr:unnamed protein product [Owenia fusiformis]
MSNMDAEALKKLAIVNSNEFNRGWNESNKNWEKFVEDFYNTDAVLYPPGSPPITGLKHISTFLEVFPNNLKLHHSLRTVKSTGEDSYFAIFSVPATIDEKQVDIFTSCEEWIKENGVWKISNDFFNSDYERVDY